MKRTRKILAIAIGAALGLYVAGYAPTSLSHTSVSFAQEDAHVEDAHVEDAHAPTRDGAQEHEVAADPHAADSADHETPESEHLDGSEGATEHHGEHGPDAIAAGELVPDAKHVPWFGNMLGIIACLFGAALVVGGLGKALGVKEPNIEATEKDQADAHNDEHDDHGDHGHDDHEKH